MTKSELDHLKEMANQIAANFRFHDNAPERVADHLNRFWAPSMRRLLAEHAHQGGDDVDDAVREAVGLLKL